MTTLRLAVIAAVLVGVTAACSERFPRPLTDGDVANVPDAAASDAAVDAESIVDAGDEAADAAPGDAGLDAAPADDAGTCNVRVAAPALEAATHVSEGSAITYGSNPPSSGAHYPVWANFQEFNHPVEDGYLVHAMEHGAVLLLYACNADAGACADTIAQLRAVRDAVTTDPMCSAAIRVRVIIAPRAANDTPIAAAAWGHTYRADCVDAPSLSAFIAAHYAKGPEDFCFQGGVF